jgi:saccharopine dehydrogenase-like NADP-dependent oxidoreductase
MKIALLGAGHIGQTIARLLHATGDYQVTVLDKNAGYLKAGRRRHRDRRGRQRQPRGAGRPAARQGAVVNALPYHLAITAADWRWNAAATTST